jgi:hypothetical protein
VIDDFTLMINGVLLRSSTSILLIHPTYAKEREEKNRFINTTSFSIYFFKTLPTTLIVLFGLGTIPFFDNATITRKASQALQKMK